MDRAVHCIDKAWRTSRPNSCVYAQGEHLMYAGELLKDINANEEVSIV